MEIDPTKVIEPIIEKIESLWDELAQELQVLLITIGVLILISACLFITDRFFIEQWLGPHVGLAGRITGDIFLGIFVVPMVVGIPLTLILILIFFVIIGLITLYQVMFNAVVYFKTNLPITVRNFKRQPISYEALNRWDEKFNADI